VRLKTQQYLLKAVFLSFLFVAIPFVDFGEFELAAFSSKIVFFFPALPFYT
jgi:hypothetical protein